MPSSDSEALVLSPQDLILKSIEKGGSVEHLEKLLEMQLRWEAAEARKAYSKAMAAFKAACPPVLAKGKLVSYKDRKGNLTEYHHTTIGAATVALTPYLSEQGLSATWETGQEGNQTVSVTCIISHEMGHSERTTLTGPYDTSGHKNSIQQLGSSVTYLQRYTLLAALGIATADQDDDAVAMNQQYRTIAPNPDFHNPGPLTAEPPDPYQPHEQNSNKSSEPADLDTAVAEKRWNDAYNLAATVDEVKAVGRALAGEVEPGEERDHYVRLHWEAIHRCTHE